MKSTPKTYLALAWAVVQGLAMAASAQIPAPGQDGRAMDANNRVGSGGFNQSVGRPGVTPNQIIYGNVTGGKGFTGPLGETDPGAFGGPLPGRFTDRFIAGSSAAPQPYQPQTDLSVAQPFFGASRGAPPPLGTVRNGFTGAYVGAPLMSDSGLPTNDLAASQDWMAQRLGAATVLGTRSNLVGTQSGEAYLEGPWSADNQQTSLSGSALYGIQPLRSTLENPTDATGGLNPASAGLLAGPGDRFRFDSAEMRRMRGELQSSEEQQPDKNNPQSNAQSPQGLAQPLGAQNAADQASNGSSGTAPNPLQTGQATQRRSTIVSPELQSEQYRELRRRLGQFENPQYAQMEAQHLARLQRQALAAKTSGAATSRPASGVGAAAMLAHPGNAALNAQAPLKITSLAIGIRASGLHDVLASAEDLMRQGKFQSAIERYDIALQIAPNNPLIPLGRANAELGAGAYRQASFDLHAVFAADHAILLAQYDLKGWLPLTRFSAINKELTALSAKDPKDEMPEFLLAYIAYNAGDAQDAARHLAQARTRAAGQDPVLDLLELEWKIPQSDQPATPARPPADLNK